MRQEIQYDGRTFVVTFRGRIAWWVRPYLKLVHAIAIVTQVEPDMDKLTRRVQRGIRPQLVKRGRVAR